MPHRLSCTHQRGDQERRWGEEERDKISTSSSSFAFLLPSRRIWEKQDIISRGTTRKRRRRMTVDRSSLLPLGKGGGRRGRTSDQAGEEEEEEEEHHVREEKEEEEEEGRAGSPREEEEEAKCGRKRRGRRGATTYRFCALERTGGAPCVPFGAARVFPRSTDKVLRGRFRERESKCVQRYVAYVCEGRTFVLTCPY